MNNIEVITHNFFVSLQIEKHIFMAISGNLTEGSKIKVKRFYKWVMYPLIAVVVMAVLMAFLTYWAIVKDNVMGNAAKLYVPTGCSFDELITILENDSIVGDVNSFMLVSKILGYDSVRAGYYEFVSPTNNIHIVRKLQMGRQTESKMVINSTRTRERLARMISKAIESDSIAVIRALTDSNLLAKYGLNDKALLPMIVIPDTYFVYWTDTPEEIIDRLYKESMAFWSEERKSKAEAKKLTMVEIVTIASIISQESNKSDELPMIAGVYINRLKKGMLLQADPTVIYAAGDWSIRRVKGALLKMDSPYNTYKYKGLPPTPITFPPKSAIDGVLNAVDHNYYYFCAKDDFSGYHTFATNYRDHTINARKYHKALNSRNVK